MPLNDLVTVREIEKHCLDRLSLSTKTFFTALHRPSRFSVINSYFRAERLNRYVEETAEISDEQRAILLSLGFEQAETMTIDALAASLKQQLENLSLYYSEKELHVARLLIFLQDYLDADVQITTLQEATFDQLYQKAFPKLKRLTLQLWLEKIHDALSREDLALLHVVSLLRLRLWIQQYFPGESITIDVTQEQKNALSNVFSQHWNLAHQLGVDYFSCPHDVINTIYVQVAEHVCDLDIFECDRNQLLVPSLHYEPFNYDDKMPLTSLVLSSDQKRLIHIPTMLEQSKGATLLHTSIIAGEDEEKGTDSESDKYLSSDDVDRVYANPLVKRYHFAMRDLHEYDVLSNPSVWAVTMRFALAIRASSVIEHGDDVETQAHTNVFSVISQFTLWLDTLTQEQQHLLLLSQRASDGRTLGWCWFHLVSSQVAVPKLALMGLTPLQLGVSEDPGLASGGEPDVIYCLAALQDTIVDILHENKYENTRLNDQLVESTLGNPLSESSALQASVELAKNNYQSWLNAQFETVSALPSDSEIMVYSDLNTSELTLFAPDDIFSLDETTLFTLISGDSHFSRRYRDEVLGCRDRLLSCNPLRVLVYFYHSLASDFLALLMTKVNLLSDAASLSEKEACLFCEYYSQLNTQSRYRMRLQMGKNGLSLKFLMRTGVMKALVASLPRPAFVIYLIKAFMNEQNECHKSVFILFLVKGGYDFPIEFDQELFSIIFSDREYCAVIFGSLNLSSTQFFSLLSGLEKKSYAGDLIANIMSESLFYQVVVSYISDPSILLANKAFLFLQALSDPIRECFISAITSTLSLVCIAKFMPDTLVDNSFLVFLDDASIVLLVQRLLSRDDDLALAQVFLPLLMLPCFSLVKRRTLMHQVIMSNALPGLLRCNDNLLFQLLSSCDVNYIKQVAGYLSLKRLIVMMQLSFERDGVIAKPYFIVLMTRCVLAKHAIDLPEDCPSDFVMVLAEQAMRYSLEFRHMRTFIAFAAYAPKLVGDCILSLDADVMLALQRQIQVMRQMHAPAVVTIAKAIVFTRVSYSDILVVLMRCFSDGGELTAKDCLLISLFQSILDDYKHEVVGSHSQRSLLFRAQFSGVSKCYRQVCAFDASSDQKRPSIDARQLRKLAQMIPTKVLALSEVTPLAPPDLMRSFSGS